MDNIYAIAAEVRRGLRYRGMTGDEASKKITDALNGAKDYKSAVKALRAL